MKIDLNCDLGEGFGRYQLGPGGDMLATITSANIACGLHAGDPTVMAETVAQACSHRVALGAHPSFPDRQGFGRRLMALSPAEVEAFVTYQLGALQGFVQSAGARLAHVKPHGALYNHAAQDSVTAQAIARAVANFDPRLIVLTLPGSELELAARAQGLPVGREGFADRAYQADGSLVPRSQPGAVIHDPLEAAARAIQLVQRGTVETLGGKIIPLEIETLCVHGDTPGAARIAAQLRQQLEAAGITIAPLTEVLACR